MLAALLIAAQPAAATQKTVPPGHSGASQYTETLPSAGGEETTESVHEGSGGGSPGGGKGDGAAQESTSTGATTPTEALGAGNAKRLEKLGPEGNAAARLAAAAGTSGANEPATRDRTDASSPVKQVVGELTGTSGSEGMGFLLPLLIVMTALVAVAFVLARRRPASPQD